MEPSSPSKTGMPRYSTDLMVESFRDLVVLDQDYPLAELRRQLAKDVRCFQAEFEVPNPFGEVIPL